MNVQIKPEFQRFLEDQVRAGRYDSTDDAINAAVATLKTKDELSADEVEELRAAVDVGLAEADRGEFAIFTAEDVIAEGRANLNKKG